MKYYSQYCIIIYAFNKLIRHQIILVFKYPIFSFVVILFVVFQKLKKSYIKNILKFINREVMCNQGKISIEILIAILIFHYISSR